MKRKLAKIATAFVLLLSSLDYAHAQNQKPYWDEIKAFQRQDSLTPPPKNPILFVGSSSFRLWKGIQETFPEYVIMNRGFGGATLSDIIRYADQIIIPYNAKQIVIYGGENDLAGKDAPTPEWVSDRFKELYQLIRSKMPTVNIVFVSIKPSPSRQHLMAKEVAANIIIKHFLAKEKNTSFVDVYSLMLDKDGMPKTEIFRDDRLHMNEKGYAIWQKAIAPYLLK